MLLLSASFGCSKNSVKALAQNSNEQAQSNAVAGIIERKTLVYFGVTDEGDGRLMAQQSNPANYSKWEFVRTHAHGYYENFITMSVNNHTSNPMGNLQKMADAYANKNCFFETSLETSVFNGDPNNEATDKQYIDILSNAGFNVDNTSLNYGITAQRVNTLRTYRYTRPCLTLGGPWTFGGDINKNYGTNATYRKNILATDGISLDGPMGKWSNNDGNIKEGTYSAIQYAHDNGKLAAMMVAPSPFFGDPNYNPHKEYLSVSKQCVLECEANNAAPDQWHVWTYQPVGIPIFPEKNTLQNGQIAPPNTLTGVAYWLIKHLNNLPLPRIPNTGQVNSSTRVDVLDSSSAQITINTSSYPARSYSMAINLVNTPDPQIEISPLFAAAINGYKADWKISFTVDSLGVTKDITNDVLNSGFNCVGNWVITNTKKFTVNMNITALKKSARPVNVDFTMASNKGNTVNKSYYTVAAKTK